MTPWSFSLSKKASLFVNCNWSWAKDKVFQKKLRIYKYLIIFCMSLKDLLMEFYRKLQYCSAIKIIKSTMKIRLVLSINHSMISKRVSKNIQMNYYARKFRESHLYALIAHNFTIRLKIFLVWRLAINALFTNVAGACSKIANRYKITKLINGSVKS